MGKSCSANGTSLPRAAAHAHVQPTNQKVKPVVRQAMWGRDDLDNGEQERLDVTGGVQGGLAALQEAQQQGPLAAGPRHCCNVYLTSPDLHAILSYPST